MDAGSAENEGMAASGAGGAGAGEDVGWACGMFDSGAGGGGGRVSDGRSMGAGETGRAGKLVERKFVAEGADGPSDPLGAGDGSLEGAGSEGVGRGANSR